MAVLRAWAAFLAGVNKMRWSKFLLYNAAGGICWATIIGLFAYFAGQIVGDNFTVVERLGQSLGFAGLAVIVGPVLIWFIVKYVRKRRQAREAVAAAAVTAAAAAPEAPIAQTPLAEAEQPASPHP